MREPHQRLLPADWFGLRALDSREPEETEPLAEVVNVENNAAACALRADSGKSNMMPTDHRSRQIGDLEAKGGSMLLIFEAAVAFVATEIDCTSFRMVFRCIALISVAPFLLATSAFACQFDTDCQPGSQCLKASGSIYGACVGGISPGNSNDREPVYSPLDLNDTYGETCQFNTDCGPGSSCVKSSGSIYGTCIRN